MQGRIEELNPSQAVPRQDFAASAVPDGEEAEVAGFPYATTGFISRVSPVQVRPLLVGVDVRSDEPISSYHSDRQWWSKSQLWDLRSRGPSLFRAKHLLGTQPYESSDALKKGTLVHEWAEDGNEAWWGRIVEIPESALGAGGRRTKATDEFEAEALSANPHAIILKSDEIAAYRAQFNAILENPIFHTLSTDTVAREFSVRWKDKSGLQLKCRPDAATYDVLWDVKTTRETQPLETFWKSAVDYGYGFQAVLYMEGARAAGLEVKDFIFLITSTVPPYACHAVTLPQRFLDRSRRMLRQTIAELQARLELDHWLPEDSGQVTELFIPERYMEDSNGKVSRHAYER
jgi:hypothetical protein